MPDDHVLIRRLKGALTRLRDEERGMTLVEATVAAMILLIGIVPTVKVFDDSRDQNATGERQEVALLQAEQALEEMRGLPYNRLLMSAGAVDPSAGRVTNAGATFRVRSDLSEPLVYATTEGAPTSNAWVEPVSTVTTGPDEAPIDMTIHRFVSWRDEECGVADLSGLGLDLPTAITSTNTGLNNVLSGLLTTVINLLTGQDKTKLQTLRTRLDALRTQLTNRQASLNSAVAGISQLDLCDLDSTAISNLQKLGQLTPGLSAAGALNDRLTALQTALSQNLCLPVVGCLLGSTQNTAINSVNSQLDCLFGSGSGSTQFGTYLGNLATGLTNIGSSVSNTQKNTKRITVAVVIEDRAGAGPFEPVWATSVVRDPTAGVLTSGSTSCN